MTLMKALVGRSDAEACKITISMSALECAAMDALVGGLCVRIAASIMDAISMIYAAEKIFCPRNVLVLGTMASVAPAFVDTQPAFIRNECEGYQFYFDDFEEKAENLICIFD